MDFTVGEEFDYEEEEPLKDLYKNDSEPKNCSVDEKSKSKNLSSCDEDYLQINCSEEDENFVFDKQPSENVDSNIPSAETPEDEKAGKEKEEKKEEKIFLRKEQCTQTNLQKNFNYNSNKNNGKSFGEAFRKFKQRKRGWPYLHRAAREKNFPKSLTRDPWFPERNFSGTDNAMQPSPGNAGFRNQSLPPPGPGSHLWAQKANFEAVQQGKNLQRPFGNKLLNSNLRFGFALQNQNSVQRWSERLDSGTQTSFHKNIVEYNISNSESNFFENFRSSESGCNFFVKNGAQTRSMVVPSTDVGLGRNRAIPNCFMPSEANNNYVGESCVQNGSSVAFRECVGTDEAPNTIPVRRGENKFPVRLRALGDYEKQLVMRKKEARLRRFMDDEIRRKKTEPVQSTINGTMNNKHLELEDYVQKEPRVVRRSILTREGHQGHNQHFIYDNTEPKYSSLLDAPNLSKVTLLKKQNPFETNSEFQTSSTVATRIKQEVLWSENSKAECAERAVSKAVTVGTQVKRADEAKILAGFEFPRPGSLVVKSETGSQVKFIRTISKSLDELGFRRPITRIAEDEHCHKPEAFFAAQESQQQTSFQLTRCIVKVLNVSPSTTINDILILCSRVGAVKEVKLNFPEENSVLIRFAESIAAEKFFSLYHGQKMNNYFLNVIVI